MLGGAELSALKARKAALWVGEGGMQLAGIPRVFPCAQSQLSFAVALSWSERQSELREVFISFVTSVFSLKYHLRNKSAGFAETAPNVVLRVFWPRLKLQTPLKLGPAIGGV